MPSDLLGTEETRRMISKERACIASWATNGCPIGPRPPLGGDHLHGRRRLDYVTAMETASADGACAGRYAVREHARRSPERRLHADSAEMSEVSGSAARIVSMPSGRPVTTRGQRGRHEKPVAVETHARASNPHRSRDSGSHQRRHPDAAWGRAVHHLLPITRYGCHGEPAVYPRACLSPRTDTVMMDTLATLLDTIWTGLVIAFLLPLPNLFSQGSRACTDRVDTCQTLPKRFPTSTTFLHRKMSFAILTKSRLHVHTPLPTEKRRA